MKVVNKYVDEISRREFAKREDAIKSEKKNGGIKRLFAFWQYPPKDKHCKFANGGWCYQRTDVDVLRFTDALVTAIKDYEPWIAEQYETNGGLQRKHVGTGYIIGRYLSDGNSELYSQYCTLACICPKCYREWGQQYYATHCTCDTNPRDLSDKEL